MFMENCIIMEWRSTISNKLIIHLFYRTLHSDSMESRRMHISLVWFILRPCQHDNGYIDSR